MKDDHNPLTKFLIVICLGAAAWAVFAILIWWLT